MECHQGVKLAHRAGEGYLGVSYFFAYLNTNKKLINTNFINFE